jgi:thioesterase domain-containing protein
VCFGKPVGDRFETADDLAAEIDRQIYSHYRLFPTNIIAWQMQGNTDGLEALKRRWPDEDWSQAHSSFQSHIGKIPANHRQIVIEAYAAPVDNQLACYSK